MIRKLIDRAQVAIKSIIDEKIASDDLVVRRVNRRGYDNFHDVFDSAGIKSDSVEFSLKLRSVEGGAIYGYFTIPVTVENALRATTPMHWFTLFVGASNSEASLLEPCVSAGVMGFRGSVQIMSSASSRIRRLVNSRRRDTPAKRLWRALVDNVPDNDTRDRYVERLAILDFYAGPECMRIRAPHVDLRWSPSSLLGGTRYIRHEEVLEKLGLQDLSVEDGAEVSGNGYKVRVTVKEGVSATVSKLTGLIVRSSARWEWEAVIEHEYKDGRSTEVETRTRSGSVCADYYHLRSAYDTINWVLREVEVPLVVDRAALFSSIAREREQEESRRESKMRMARRAGKQPPRVRDEDYVRLVRGIQNKRPDDARRAAAATIALERGNHDKANAYRLRNTLHNILLSRKGDPRFQEEFDRQMEEQMAYERRRFEQTDAHVVALRNLAAGRDQ